jgi:hypothetical protein
LLGKNGTSPLALRRDAVRPLEQYRLCHLIIDQWLERGHRPRPGDPA